MASSTHFQVQGQRLEFRYKVSTTREAVQIWLEDCQSKEQWQTKLLTLNEFTTSDNILAQASIGDYAKQFHACIGAPDACKSLTGVDEEGSRVLMLRLSLDVSMYTTTLVYEFQLKKIDVDRLDALAATVRDVKDAISGLRDDVARIQAQVDGNEAHQFTKASVKVAVTATQDDVKSLSARMLRLEDAVYAMENQLMTSHPRSPPFKAPFGSRPRSPPRPRSNARFGFGPGAGPRSPPRGVPASFGRRPSQWSPPPARPFSPPISRRPSQPPGPSDWWP